MGADLYQGIATRGGLELEGRVSTGVTNKAIKATTVADTVFIMERKKPQSIMPPAKEKVRRVVRGGESQGGRDERRDEGRGWEREGKGDSEKWGN